MLSDELMEYNIPQALMQRLSELLTPTSVYQTDIWSLQDKISKESRCRGTNGLKLRVNTSSLGQLFLFKEKNQKIINSINLIRMSI